MWPFPLVIGDEWPKPLAHLAPTNISKHQKMKRLNPLIHLNYLPILLPVFALIVAVLLVGCRPAEPVLLEVQLSDCAGEPLVHTPVRWTSGGTFGAPGGLSAPVLQWTDAAGRLVRPSDAGQRLELVEAGGFGLGAQDVFYPAGYDGSAVEMVFPRLWHVLVIGKPMAGGGEGAEGAFVRRLEFGGEVRQFMSDEAVVFPFSYWGCEAPDAPILDGDSLSFLAFASDTLELNF